MRLFAAYFAHETNSFSPIPTNLDSFRELGIHRPGPDNPASPEALKGAWHFYEEARRRGDDIVVGLCAHAQPSRPMRGEDYRTLRDWLLEDLRNAGSELDMVLLFMHGSMMSEDCDDCEADVLQRIREIVGDHVPIGLLLDLHCNISGRMLREATVIMACKEYPHTDFRERAQELYDICARTSRRQVAPRMALARVPMFGLFQTAYPPMRPFIDSIIERESAPGVLSISLGHGFPWSDFSGAGASVLAVTDGEPQLAATLARSIAREFFDLRDRGQVSVAGIDEVLDEAAGVPEGTVVVADMSDNPGGGAASDSTYVLQSLLERGVRDAAIAYLWDPVSVQLAFAAGEGARLPMRIGGKVGPASGTPVDLEVTVSRLRSDANQAHIADGTATHLGRTAVVTAHGIDIALNEIRQQPFTPEGLAECGIDPWAKRLLVLKSSHHFYAGFHLRSERILYCDAPGTLNRDLRRLPFRHLGRPIWPLDEIEHEVPDRILVPGAD